MYTQEVLLNARNRRKHSWTTPVLFTALALILLILGLIYRVKLLAVIGFVVPLMAAFFSYDMFCAPEVHYVRFVRDVLTGRSHDVVGTIVSVGDTVRMSEEGVAIYDMVVRTQDDIDTLFYWDQRMPLPACSAGQAVEGIAFGRYITKLEDRQNRQE